MTGRVVLFGATGYTGRLAADAIVARGLDPFWRGGGAERVAAGAVSARGARGPVEAFGVEELERGIRESGIARVPWH